MVEFRSTRFFDGSRMNDLEKFFVPPAWVLILTELLNVLTYRDPNAQTPFVSNSSKSICNVFFTPRDHKKVREKYSLSDRHRNPLETIWPSKKNYHTRIFASQCNRQARLIKNQFSSQTNRRRLPMSLGFWTSCTEAKMTTGVWQ